MPAGDTRPILLQRLCEGPGLAIDILIAARIYDQAVRQEGVSAGVPVWLVRDAHAELRVARDNDLSRLQMHELL